MNRDESILYRTGQKWKFWLMPLCVWVGIAMMLIASWLKDRLETSWLLGAIFFAALMILGGFVLPAIIIKCPNCGARWFWLAVTKQQSKNWFRWLFQTGCPVCGINEHAE